MTAHTAFVRPQAQRPPLSHTARALLVPVAVTAPLAAWLVAAAPESLRVPAAAGAGAGLVLLCIAMATAARANWRSHRLRDRVTALEADADRFADDSLPLLVQRLKAGDSAGTALAATPGSLSGAHGRALATVAGQLSGSESGRAAAMSACANAAGRMQALATSMLADLRTMEHRHTDPDVLGDLLHLDHRTAQAGRLSDSIAVLTGARSGRRWAKPIKMESILRGAMGRISGYQRVRTHSTSEAAIAGHAAEGVMHALAELLDNAANFSPPTAEVHVYVEEVPAGLVITVEDSGLVMGEVALRRARHAVAATATDLAGLSGTRLGLAVVGRLARKHGLTVSFRPSARGGTGALMMIPQDLITRPLPQPLPHRAEPDPEPDLTGPEYTAGGLPQRRRGRTLATSAHHRQPAPRDRSPHGTAAERAARFSAFREAVRGKTTPTPEGDPR
jgi:signal transduction histidine kinase